MEKTGPLKEGEFWVVWVPEKEMTPQLSEGLKKTLDLMAQRMGRPFLVMRKNYDLEISDYGKVFQALKIPNFWIALDEIRAAVNELQDKNPLENKEIENVPYRFITEQNVKLIAKTLTHILDQCKKVGFE